MLDHVAYRARSVAQEFDDVKAVGLCQSFECFEHAIICLTENMRVKTYSWQGMYMLSRTHGLEIEVRMARPGLSEAAEIGRQCGSFDLRSAVLSSCTQLDQRFRLLGVI